MKLGKKSIIGIIIAVAVLIVLSFSFAIVPAGHTGVRVTLGQVEGVVEEGFNIKTPFIQDVKIIDNRVQKTEVDTESFSKDLQTVETNVAVHYRITPDKSNHLYKTVGLHYNDIIIVPTVNESMKSITAQYTADELVSSRQKVSTEIVNLMGVKLEEYGFTVTAVNILDFKFSEEFIRAIEEKQVAQQNALKAEQDLARIKIEAEQKVAQAKAEAEAYRLQSRQLTDNMIKAKWIEKWDGKLPHVQSGDSGNVIIDMRDNEE